MKWLQKALISIIAYKMKLKSSYLIKDYYDILHKFIQELLTS